MTTLLIRPRAPQRAERLAGGFMVEKGMVRVFYTPAAFAEAFEVVGEVAEEPAPLAPTGTEEAANG